MRKKTQKTEEKKQIVAPRLVKAADVAAREAAVVEQQQQAPVQKIVKPVVRTPRSAVEARDMFNALFNEAA